MDVVVVGGGLAGLVTTRHLAEAGIDVTLLEAESEIGGRVRTTREDGFVFDRGFQVLFPSYPAVQRELDLSLLDLRYFRPGATLVRPGERSTLSDPIRDPRALTATLFNRDISLGDKLRTAKLRRELSRKPLSDIEAADESSIQEYLEARGFSERFIEHFARPFYGGITLDRSLSTSAFVFEYTFKMLGRTSAAVPAGGMGALPAQVASRAEANGATVETDTTVTTVESDDGTGEQVTIATPSETLSADAVVVATDPRTAQDLTGCETIPTESVSCVTQHFSLPKTQQLNTDSRLLLNADSARPNQVAVMTDVAPEYAPKRTHLLSATFLGTPEETDEELAREVRSSLESWYPENNFADLELLRTDRVEFAQFQQPPGFRQRLPTVDEPGGSVYLAGDYTEWSSIQGAMESGRRAAEHTLDTHAE